uniref:Uncharacterized protein n=1 Tax=Anguilla anguilla TaxID=7936 RepID=A0A0E9TLA3_ANGAN
MLCGSCIKMLKYKNTEQAQVTSIVGQDYKRKISKSL